MAAGYARASGKVGVFMVTSGPGATNSVTPIRDCMADSIPVVLICGQVPRAAIGTDAFQEAPVFNIMSACAKRAFLVLDPEELEATVRTAFEIARSDRPGPVVLDIPKDVQNWKGDVPGRRPAETSRLSRAHAGALRIANVGIKGRRVLRHPAKERTAADLCGWRHHQERCSARTARFATTFQIPVVTTLQAIGSFDTTHPLVASHARHARHGVRQLCGRRLRFPDRCSARDSMTVWRAMLPSSRPTRPTLRTSTSMQPRSER